ncbi:hypothetical protein AX17_005269 [Amanita inopinata Kibby_2008]|nr:hypothetical protein AX17_005269 [Amanita inopinata Kibby_2008]
MSEHVSQDELEGETQEQDNQIVSGDENIEDGPQETIEDGPPSKKRKIRKEPIVLTREPGKSLLPFSRVQKIIKADKDMPMVAKDATFLISLATEEFIKRLCQASQNVAVREKRATVQHRDIATVVRKADEFLFLEELIPWTAADPPPKRKFGGDSRQGISAAPTLLDQFVISSKKESEKSENEVVMNEDGTMFVEGEGESDENDD